MVFGHFGQNGHFWWNVRKPLKTRILANILDFGVSWILGSWISWNPGFHGFWQGITHLFRFRGSIFGPLFDPFLLVPTGWIPNRRVSYNVFGRFWSQITKIEMRGQKSGPFLDQLLGGPVFWPLFSGFWEMVILGYPNRQVSPFWTEVLKSGHFWDPQKGQIARNRCFWSISR